MKYLYYPGCSLEGTALEYNVSTRAVMAKLGVELIDVNDWTCCGATSAEAASHLLNLTLSARNLALAEQMKVDADLLAPCSACYLNLKKAEVKIGSETGIKNKINEILAEDDLTCSGAIKVRHLLDVMSCDIGPGLIKEKTVSPLNGLKIAPYYGCQCLRPYAVFDDPEKPESMQPLLKAVGAEIYDWDMGGRCCGASHMTTKSAVGLELTAAILSRAIGADAVATVCPMCQMNLDAFQKKLISMEKLEHEVSILYLPQLIGLAIGLSRKDLRMDLNLCVTEVFKAKIS